MQICLEKETKKMNNTPMSMSDTIRLRIIGIVFIVAIQPAMALAGIYSGPTNTTNSIDPAIPSASSRFVEWANAIDASRTYFAPRGSTSISSTGYNCLGDLDATQIANGDSPGYLTVTFPHGICNRDGADFAVFENGFAYGSPNGLFMELAYVEVSSNGADFIRFPSIYTNTAPVQGSGSFAGFDTTNIYNLAGKHAEGYGTPFDLTDLISEPGVVGGAVDLNNIQYVKLVDIPGNGSFFDSQDHPILDNWLTTGSGGFDFRLPAGKGVGVVHAVPEPSSLAMLGLTAVAGLFIRRYCHRRAAKLSR
jgi:hypothetical protein